MYSSFLYFILFFCFFNNHNYLNSYACINCLQNNFFICERFKKLTNSREASLFVLWIKNVTAKCLPKSHSKIFAPNNLDVQLQFISTLNEFLCWNANVCELILSGDWTLVWKLLKKEVEYSMEAYSLLQTGVGIV